MRLAIPNTAWWLIGVCLVVGCVPSPDAALPNAQPIQPAIEQIVTLPPGASPAASSNTPNATPRPVAPPRVPGISIPSGYALTVAFANPGASFSAEVPASASVGARLDGGAVQWGISTNASSSSGIDFVLRWNADLPPGTHAIAHTTQDATAPVQLVSAWFITENSRISDVLPPSVSGTFTLTETTPTSVSGTFQWVGASDQYAVGVSGRFVGVPLSS